MTRTRHPGYLRDIRRLTVALSRARLGLYILGRRSVFHSSPELAQAFHLPFERPENLVITTGELFPSSRLLDAEIEGTEMAGVEHLGQYVFEMTHAKVESLKRGDEELPLQEAKMTLVDDDDDDEMEVSGQVEAIVDEEPEEPEDFDEIS